MLHERGLYLLMSTEVFKEKYTLKKRLCVFSLRHFAVLLSWPLLCFPPRLPVAPFPSLSFVLVCLLFTFLLWCSVLELLLLCLSCLLAFILFFFSSLPCSFSLSSSARLPSLALTGGYSSLGWAETASLYNTDRLLCNQIPSVATSEDSLSRFLHHTHTHLGTRMHTHTPHLCFPLLNNVCVRVWLLCTMTRVPTIIPPDSFLACTEEVTGVTFTTSCFCPPLPLGFKGHCLQVSMFALWLCVSARPWLLYQTGDCGLLLLSLRSTAHYLKGCQPFPMFAQCLSLVRHRKRWHGPQGLSPSPSSLRGRLLSHAQVQEHFPFWC